jgi:hypothetical protein
MFETGAQTMGGHNDGNDYAKSKIHAQKYTGGPTMSNRMKLMAIMVATTLLLSAGIALLFTDVALARGDGPTIIRQGPWTPDGAGGASIAGDVTVGGELTATSGLFTGKIERIGDSNTDIYFASDYVRARAGSAVGLVLDEAGTDIIYVGGDEAGANLFDQIVLWTNTTVGTTAAVTNAKLTVQGGIAVNSADGHGGLIRQQYAATAAITADAAITINTNVPSGAKVIGVQLHVKTALTGGETWDAKLNDGGDEETIATAQAVAQNTNVNFFSDDGTGGLVTDAETDVVITKNGGGAFTAAGEIEAVVYAWVFAAWANE